jgi:CRISPR-associated protein Csh2
MNNSQILFIYDAQMCNPNGDPDEENRPRMDYPTQTNLVSDVRLKRYIRDYLSARGHDLYVQKSEEGEVVTAGQRITEILGQQKAKKLAKEDLNRILEKLVDIRLFGATIPVKLEDQKGQSISFTGPVQFNWGYSLNRVYLLDSQTITSRFSSEAGREQGTIGKDYRVKYSLIAFHGVISGYNAERTKLRHDDIQLLDEAMLKAIPLHATRSKIGQTPRVYIRVEYNSKEFILPDFRQWIKIELADGKKAEEVLSINDIILDLSRLIEKLEAVKQHIATTHFWIDPDIQIKGNMAALPNANRLEA